MKIPSQFIIIEKMKRLSKISITQFSTIKGDVYYICSGEDSEGYLAFKSAIHSRIKKSNKNVLYWMRVCDLIELHNAHKIIILKYTNLEEVQDFEF